MKSCPLCSVLVPNVSISEILGMNLDDGLPSPFCFVTVGLAVGGGPMVIVPFARFCAACTYCVDYVRW